MTRREIDSLNEQYDVAMLGESYTLTPKASDNLFETLTLEFDSDQLTRMAFLDSLGQTTIIQFRNIRINEPVPDERFVFETPAGVDSWGDLKRDVFGRDAAGQDACLPHEGPEAQVCAFGELA